MADSLTFNGSSDYINFTPGGIDGTGALTFVAIVKVASDTSVYRNVLGWNAIDAVFGISNDLASRLTWYPLDGPAYSTATVVAADGWCLVALSKPDGVALPIRFHKFPYGGSWTHEDVSAGLSVELPTATRVILGAHGALSGNWWDGNILIAGWWDSQLSDGAIEALASGQDAWTTASPTEAWRLDTAGSISAFVGTSTQQGRSGTSVATGDAPTGWTDLGGTPQTLCPDADTTTTGWTTTPLWSKLGTPADGTVVTATAA